MQSLQSFCSCCLPSCSPDFTILLLQSTRRFLEVHFVSFRACLQGCLGWVFFAQSKESSMSMSLVLPPLNSVLNQYKKNDTEYSLVHFGSSPCTFCLRNHYLLRVRETDDHSFPLKRLITNLLPLMSSYH